MNPVYFDNASTTSVDPKVMDAMLPYFTEHFGNANSAHQFGRTSKVAIEDAREKIASIIGAEPSEIIFTSGGTESDNAIIKGVVAATRKQEVITSPVEHHAVMHPAESLKLQGGSVIYLTPSGEGIVEAAQVQQAITEKTAIVSLMHVNNEIGSINPIQEIASICRSRGVVLHSDTVQSAGKVPLNVKELGVDSLSLSAHKIHGPKGIGVLYVRNGTPWIPWLQGGSQERRRRGGTLNVTGIVGMATALGLAAENLETSYNHVTSLRKYAISGLKKRFGDRLHLNSPESGGVPHILNIAFKTENENGLDGEMLLLNLDIEGICVSNGSACTSGAMEPSHVLIGIGTDQKIAKSSIRISFCKQNSKEQIDYFLEKLDAILHRMIASPA